MARKDRLNPVFLKELRQALRGRMFALLFPGVIVVGVGLAIAVLVDSVGRANIGPVVFMPIITVLGVAVLGLVPFSAFQSMAGEWDEGTHDLLVLSHLSPMRIVLGKLLTASIEAGLYVSAFLPLLLFTFLLSGVDVRDVLLLVGLLFGASLAMSCAAMALAGLSRLKFWRVILLAALTGLGVLALIGGYDLAETIVLRGRGVGGSLATLDVWVSAVSIVLVGSIGFAFAATRIAHPEDDRSGPVRIVLTALLVTGLILMSTYNRALSMAGYTTEAAMVFGVIASCIAVFFVTEPERLPRRTASRVPTNSLLAFLATPFLSGGGRGVLWWLLQVAILSAWATAMSGVATSAPVARSWQVDGLGRWAAMMAYFFVYLAGVSLVLTRLRRRPHGPLLARFILPGVAVLSMVVPILIGFLVGNNGWENGRHALNPFWAAGASNPVGVRFVACLVAAIVLAVNLPRFGRAFREVLAASRARRRAPSMVEESAAHVA